MLRDFATRTKTGRVRVNERGYSGKGPEYRMGSGRQRNQGQAETEHQRVEETRSSIKMVDQNSGTVKVVSLSDIFSSSGALQFREELDNPGVFIPTRTSGRGRGGRRGEYVVVHGEANKGKRRFDDDLRGWTDYRVQSSY